MKRILISFAAKGSPGSDAVYLHRVAAQVNTNAPGLHAITPLVGSPFKGFQATIDDPDNSQLTANGMAQAVKDSGGPASGYKASEVASTGVITELAAPVPV